jgi:hypothetical protein
VEDSTESARTLQTGVHPAASRTVTGLSDPVTLSRRRPAPVVAKPTLVPELKHSYGAPQWRTLQRAQELYRPAFNQQPEQLDLQSSYGLHHHPSHYFWKFFAIRLVALFGPRAFCWSDIARQKIYIGKLTSKKLRAENKIRTKFQLELVP